MRSVYAVLLCLIFIGSAPVCHAQQAAISVDASHELHRVTRMLTGACIEDVNHEIYGGLYSQMIFGESFQEPAPIPAIIGFRSHDGDWNVSYGVLSVSKGDGCKLVADSPLVRDGEISVDIQFDDARPGNAGLILRVSKPMNGANNFFGYEVSLDPIAQVLRLGRHKNNWEHIQDVPCKIVIGKWVNLRVTLSGNTITVFVDTVKALTFQDPKAQSLRGDQIGLRQWQRHASFKNLKVTVNSETHSLAFVQAPSRLHHRISGMWRSVETGTATGEFDTLQSAPFVGIQSQQIRFTGGEGSVGINNQGLNRWGLNFQAGKEYEGVLFARSESPCQLTLATESSDGSQILSETQVDVTSPVWQRIEFKLKPATSVTDGRFTLKLKAPGSVSIGYVFLQPGSWGRYKNLPVRRDIAEMLVEQGITMLRYGGSMINNDHYKWKNMIGPRAVRPPYAGHWYKYSSNGWGILDFMNFCEVARFEYVPTFSMIESPDDMADFVRYAKGSRDSEWGQKRVADGRLEPYELKYLQLGNEERVDEVYAEKFNAMAEAIWAIDKSITLIVGEFRFDENITDPASISKAASGITTLDGHRKILEFAKQHNQEIWFDVHTWTGGPRPDSSFEAMFTYNNALEKLVEGAKLKVLTFEFNANSHDQRRALANAIAINAIERDGRFPMAASANGLQPDGQNDNGWNQGLLFLSPSKVWLQPPGYVTQMYSNHFAPRVVACTVTDLANELDCTAKLSEDGKKLVCQVVNLSSTAKATKIDIAGFKTTSTVAEVKQMSASLDAVNTEADSLNVAPIASTWQHKLASGADEFTFAPNSVTIVIVR